MKNSTKCTKCGASPAYISFNGDVECSNVVCEYYSESLYPPELEISTSSNDGSSSHSKNNTVASDDEDDEKTKPNNKINLTGPSKYNSMSSKKNGNKNSLSGRDPWLDELDQLIDDIDKALKDIDKNKKTPIPDPFTP